MCVNVVKNLVNEGVLETVSRKAVTRRSLQTYMEDKTVIDITRILVMENQVTRKNNSQQSNCAVGYTPNFSNETRQTEQLRSSGVPKKVLKVKILAAGVSPPSVPVP